MLKCPKASHPLSTNIACLYANERIDLAKIVKRFDTTMFFMQNSLKSGIYIFGNN